MAFQHTALAEGAWQKLSLREQLANIGSEVGRAARAENKDKKMYDGACSRALELIDLTMADPRWCLRLKEISRARELLCRAFLGDNTYHTTLADLERYFFHFALAVRLRR